MDDHGDVAGVITGGHSKPVYAIVGPIPASKLSVTEASGVPMSVAVHHCVYEFKRKRCQRRENLRQQHFSNSDARKHSPQNLTKEATRKNLFIVRKKLYNLYPVYFFD